MRSRFEPLLLLPLLFYLAMPTRNFYWDGVAFAINIEKRLPAAYLLHPSHLVYALAGDRIYRLSQLLGFHGNALFLLQAVNGVLGGLCVPLFYKCLRLRHVPEDLAIPAALVFGFSATWWKFATDADAYVPSIFFVLCAYVLLESRTFLVLAGLAQSGALLFHELAIFFVPVALVRLRKSRRLMFTYAAIALAPVAVAYLAAYILVANDRSIPGFISWASSHSADSGFNFSPLTDAGLSLRGTLRMFFGGKLGDFAWDGISKATFAVLVAAAVLFFVQLWRAVRVGGTILWPTKHLVLWAGIYIAFLFFWMPQNTFYRLFYLPPLIALVATILPTTPAARSAAWLFVPVLFGWNFCFDLYPQSRPDFNAPLRFALAQAHTWPEGTPILYSRFHPDLWTISYFSRQAAWIGIDHVDIADLDRRLEYAQARNVTLWLEENAYDLIAADPDGLRWLSLHEQPSRLLEFKDERHDFRFHFAK